MKNKILSVVFLCLIFPVFSFDFPTIQNTRNLGMGGNYIADTNSFYAFINNPGNLGIQKKQFVPFTTTTQIGGNINNLAKLLLAFTGKLDESFDITSVFDQDYKFHGTGPLGAGSTNKFFGWAVFNDNNLTFRLEAKTEIVDEQPIVTVANKVNFSESFLSVVGFCFPINIKNIGISIGANVKPFVATSAQAELPLNSIIDYPFGSIPVNFSAGISFDAGTTISFTEYVRCSLVLKNFYSLGYKTPSRAAREYLSLGNVISLFEKENFYLGDINLNTVIAGIGITIPTKKITAGLVSRTTLYANFDNVMGLFFPDFKIKEQLLNFSAGMELLLLQTIALRCGFSDAHPSFGAGIQYEHLTLDLAVFTDELGTSIGENSQLNLAFGLTLQF